MIKVVVFNTLEGFQLMIGPDVKCYHAQCGRHLAKRVWTTSDFFSVSASSFVSRSHCFVILLLFLLFPFLFHSFPLHFHSSPLHFHLFPLHSTPFLTPIHNNTGFFSMVQRLILRSSLKSVAATNAFRVLGRVAGHPNRAPLPILSRPFATSVGTGDYLSRKHPDQKDFVHGEPSGPKILTGTIPGPKTKAGLQNLDSLQDTRAATMMTGNNNDPSIA